MTNHPNNTYFDLGQAHKYLEFAIQFTPQYGDSFLEIIRVCHLMKQSNQVSISEHEINEIMFKTQ